MDVFDSSLRILASPVFLERFHHVPNREQGDDNSVEGLHLHARLVGRLDARRHDDPVRSYVEDNARRGDRDRMGVREDLPDRFHRLECGDFGRGKRVPFFDMPCADGANRPGLETNRPGRHRAAVHVRLRPDVDHLRHRERKRLPRYFTVRALSTHRRGAFRKWEGRHARARGLCQVSTSDAKRVIYDARASGGAVNEPNTDTGNPGTGTGTTPSTPPTPPAKASNGPKHDKCVHMNDHIPDQARVHGANWYRFYDRAACTALQSLADFVSIF